MANKNQCPCDTCTHVPNPAKCTRSGVKNCPAWSSWWLAQWERIYRYGLRYNTIKIAAAEYEALKAKAAELERLKSAK